MNLKERILCGIEEAGNNTVLITESEILSYKTLLEEANTLAKLLESKNLNHSTFLCLEVSKNTDFLIALVASIISKLVLIPIKHGLSKDDKEALLSTCTPESLLTKKDDKWIVSSTNLVPSKEARALVPEGGFIRPTSGTTSSSKGVLISSDAALERVNASTNSLELTRSDKVLCLMAYPYHFIASLLSFIAEGLTIITPNIFSEDALKACCKENLPTLIYGSPYHFSLLSEMEPREELKEIRLAISTGTKLTSSTRARFAEHHNKPITEIFGIIEVGLALQNKDSNINLSSIAPIENSMSNEGSLLLRGPGLFSAYLSPFRKSSEVLKDSWFDTGDLVETTLDNQILILGRSSSVIHIGAHKVFPEEIEDKLLEIEGISQARVYGIKHDLFGSEIQADVKSDFDLNEKEIITCLRKTLGPLKTPKKINFTDSIELTPSGKTKRI